MAKLEKTLSGDFDTLLERIEKGILDQYHLVKEQDTH